MDPTPFVSRFSAVVIVLAAAACGGPLNTAPSSLPASVSSPAPAPAVTPAPTPAAIPSPPATPTPPPAATPTPNAGLAYNPDLKRVFDSDCIGCHGGAQPIAGYSATAYSSVMKDVRPGDPNCTLVKITRPGEAMYGNFSGDRAAKAALVYDWVVKYGAAQNL